MWDQLLALVSKVRPAYKRVSATGEGEIVLSVSGTMVLMLIPDWLAGKYAEFTMDGADVDILFCDSSGDVVYGQVSSVDAGTKAVTTHVQSGRHVADGATRGWIVPLADKATHISVEASAAGKLYIGVSSQQLLR
jgi:hypothetical protein